MTRPCSDRFVVSTPVRVTVAAVALGISVACSPYPKANDRTTITLNQVGDNKDTCRPDDVGTLSQYQGKPVTWEIVNNCPDSYYVRVGNFRLRDPQNGNRPASTP